MDVMLWGRMSCVLVQHHVKMIMITDASDLKTSGIRFTQTSVNVTISIQCYIRGTTEPQVQ